MLVSSGRLPPDSETWSYEVKWDGSDGRSPGLATLVAPPVGERSTEAVKRGDETNRCATPSVSKPSLSRHPSWLKNGRAESIPQSFRVDA